MAAFEPAAAGGYHGGVAPAISVDEVARQALEIARDVGVAELDALAGVHPHLRIDDLHAGYGQMVSDLFDLFGGSIFLSIPGEMAKPTMGFTLQKRWPPTFSRLLDGHLRFFPDF